MKTNVQNTSIQALYEYLDTGELSDCRKEVLNGFLKHGNHTNLELSILINMPINILTARTNELVKMGYIINTGEKRLSEINGNICGKNAIVWGIPKIIIKPRTNDKKWIAKENIPKPEIKPEIKFDESKWIYPKQI